MINWQLNEESRFAQNEESLLDEERKIRDEEFVASNENSSFSREARFFILHLKHACVR